MFIKNIFNSSFKKTTSIILSIMMLGGLTIAPTIASANNGLHFGLGLQSNVKMHDDFNKEDFSLKGEMNGQLKDAQKTFKASVKQARENYRTAVRTSRDKLNTSLKASSDASARVTIIKTYFADQLAAFKTRNAAIEAAFQAFINMQFNASPTANTQSVTVAKNTAAAITLTGSDPENNALTYLVVSSTSHGTLSGTVPSLTYTPTTNFTGSDSFTFKVNDGTSNSATATVGITVTP